MATFATQAALALDRIQAVADREALAVVSDRDRIARDLHDVVIQRLFATGLQLQGVRGQAGDPLVTERLDQAVADLDETIRDIRSTIFELRQARTDGVLSQVRAMAEEYAEPLGFLPLVRNDGPVDTAVDDRVADELLAVLREALSNVARHAAATETRIELRVDDRVLELSVTDDGIGPAHGRPRERPGQRAPPRGRPRRQLRRRAGGAVRHPLHLACTTALSRPGTVAHRQPHPRGGQGCGAGAFSGASGSR